MDNLPWVTGLLSHMVITYMEERGGGDAKVGYRSILSVVPGFEKTADAKSVLNDIHRWFPQPVFRELVRQCEILSGRKDLGYQAAVHYFASKKAASLLQILARTFRDVRVALSCAGLWAPAYSNMLQIFSFEKEGWETERGIVARFDPAAKPSVAAIGLLRGNIEGFVRMCGGIAEARCQEEISQLRLQDLVEEFPGYESIDEEGRILIRERGTGRTIAEAEVVYLKSEEVIGPPAPLVQEALPRGPERGRVLAAEEESDPLARSEGTRAHRITRGGTLHAGNLSYTLAEGTLLGAPYSRLRCVWTSEKRVSESKPSGDLSALSGLLVEHLREIRKTQERALAEARENLRLAQEGREAYPFGIISRSPRMEKVFDFIRALTQVESTVLICGETGTGKELVARAIHEAGTRTDRPFGAVNCGALSESLLESELFGHEKGAFTGAISRKKGRFELADGGTLFLDEIGEISPAMQVKLLRVLQEQQFERVGGSEPIRVDVRMIAATNRDLLSMIAGGRFRQDLYYRLNVVQILLPPLRERREDIPLLVQHFLKKSAERMSKKPSGITPETMQILMGYSWPGNIRELQNVIERGVVLAPHRGWIGPDLLPTEMTAGTLRPKVSIDDRMADVQWSEIEEWLRKEGSLDGLLVKIQWSIVRKAVERHQGNKTQAAAALKRTYRWLRKFEIKTKELEADQNPT
jgi:transcriptional regulator with GAF, ATPase, and Fis domain